MEDKKNKLFNSSDFNKKTNNEQTTSNKKHLKFIGIVVAVAVILALGIGLFLLQRKENNPEKEAIEQASINRESESTNTVPADSTETAKDSESDEAVAETPNEDVANTKNSKVSKPATEAKPTEAPNTTVEKVNNKSSSADVNVEDKAKEVIKGVYGNGKARKNALGNQYASIQARVNEIYRQNNGHF